MSVKLFPASKTMCWKQHVCEAGSHTLYGANLQIPFWLQSDDMDVHSLWLFAFWRQTLCHINLWLTGH